MPRRALRKIDASLELTRHLSALADLPAPFEASRLFSRPAGLVVEVGSGKGLFLASAAAAHPDLNFLGLEVAGKYARYSAARLAKAGLSNARLLHGDARRFFAEWLPSCSVTAAHVYFPDPWWKARHKKRRILDQSFLADVERTLVPGGWLHFWTDVEEYFLATLALVAEATGLLACEAAAARAAEHDLDYQTHFERRVRLAGGAVHRGRFQKRP
jgi:tRNA (guanine-N7-)-methyltransferase